MKKVLLFAAFAAFAMTTINAQDDDSSGLAQSDIYMTAVVGFNSVSAGDFDSSSMNFSPSLGYMVTDNISLEAAIIVNNAESPLSNFPADDNYVDGDKTKNFGFGVGARWFANPGSKFSFNVGAGLSYNTVTIEEESSDDFKTNVFSFAVAPGVNYWVSDKFGLVAEVAALRYTSAKADFDGAEAATQFGLNIDLNDINFGMVYKF
jgi:outer membrane protein W